MLLLAPPTLHRAQLPYDYYALPFCKPDVLESKVENLGEVLHGSVIQNSAYDVHMGRSDFKVISRSPSIARPQPCPRVLPLSRAPPTGLTRAPLTAERSCATLLRR